MIYIRTIIGAAIAGILAMSIWGAYASAYGVAGGWLAAIMIIGIMWFLNHFVGLIHNPGASVDMALGIAVTGTMRDIFIKGPQNAMDSVPTLLLVVLGGITGGIVAVMCQRSINQVEQGRIATESKRMEQSA
jgi:hypothetical protein